ncbi:uncharacterized protein LOC116208945 [Punica granatum]|uniref:Uncharacterized protein LOC116208945 n=1 Tax=Punica granatum TaxID=22663 RepID=A0A6P8DM06_PUNGR|nr:uncharacterized protein LOC116208945 [Punica granatum]
MANLAHPGHQHALIQQEISENCRVACSMCVLCFSGIPSADKAPLASPTLTLTHPHTRQTLYDDYNCGDCSFSLAANFAIATLSTPQDEQQEEKEDVIEHISHEHPLTSFHVNVPNWFMCRGCWLRISGRVYGCRRCLFLLHESCARAPRTNPRHPFHPQHPLTLVFDCGKGFHCQACDTERHNYLAYYCHECRVHLDMACASAISFPSHPSPEREHEAEGPTMIQHFSHRHPLKFMHLSTVGTDIRCQVCELNISGELYCCPECIFFVHKLCADELPQEIAHYLHAEHPLTYQGECQYKSGGFRCNCCLREYIGKASFHCERCHFDLDPKCAMQTHSAFQGGIATKIQAFSYLPTMTLSYFKPKKNLIYLCVVCMQPITTECLTYRLPDTMVLHMSCAQQPLELEHPFHPQHQLKFLPRSTSAQHFYCSACHVKSEGSAFHCAECEFLLDLACASLKPTLKHHRHEHSLAYFQRSPYKYPRGNACRRSSRIDVYCCLPCNFNLHHKCLALPPIIEHERHPYHPLVLFDKFVQGDPNDQYCDFCEEIRNPDHGVYRCDECWYTTHIDCIISRSEEEGNTSEQIEDPRLTKLNEEIAGLEEMIKVVETNLEALTENMEALNVRGERILKREHKKSL